MGLAWFLEVEMMVKQVMLHGILPLGWDGVLKWVRVRVRLNEIWVVVGRMMGKLKIPVALISKVRLTEMVMVTVIWN